MRKLICVALGLVLLLAGCAAKPTENSTGTDTAVLSFVVLSMPEGKNAHLETDSNAVAADMPFVAYVFTEGMDFSGEDAEIWVGLLPAGAPHGGAEKDFEVQLEYFYAAEYNGGKDIPFIAPSDPGEYHIRLYTSFEGEEIGYLPITVTEKEAE